MELLVLDKDFRTISVVDTYQSLIWTDRYSKYGDFEIYTSSDKANIENLQIDYYLWSDESDHLMIIEDRKIESDVEMGAHLTVTGRSLESILDRRIVWEQTNLNGKIEGQVQKLLEQNIISPSISSRKIENFVYEESGDPAIEELTINAQFTGDDLYSAVKKICESVNIGFKITLNENKEFVFKLYSGTDRSYHQSKNPYVVFSPNFENIVDSNYYESKKLLKNISLVAGEGEGSARRTTVVGNADLAGLDRRELFTDARDISSSTSSGTLSTSQYDFLLRQRGLENLAVNKMIQSFDGQVEATRMYRYGEHFYMGDITELENEYGTTSRVRVIEYINSEDENGKVSYPTFEVLEEEEEEEEE